MEVIKTEKGLVKAWIDGVQFDDNTKAQATTISELPFIHKHVALMPDCHLGKGSTVGSVIPTKKAIIPASVGVDIGCGMCAVKTDLVANQLPTNLRDVRMAIEDAVPVGFKHHGANAVPTATEAIWPTMWENWKRIAELTGDDKVPATQLGTLGEGNHFIELCLDESNCVWIMLHSGSRGIGNLIGRTFIEKAKTDMRVYHIDLPDKDLAYLPEGTKHFDDYWFALQWAQNFASANRAVMLDLVTKAIGQSLGKDIRYLDKVVNCHHNYVALENHFGENVYVTRKGAVRARVDDTVIIPSAMGQTSYIAKGKGNKDSFHSCSHGAGRKFSRTEAKRRFTVDQHKQDTKGVECRKGKDVLDETPRAYKDIDAVMKAQSDLVEVQHALKAVLCVKG